MCRRLLPLIQNLRVGPAPIKLTFVQMGFTKKLQYFLVHTAKLSNKAALELMQQKRVSVNGYICTENCEIDSFQEIAIDTNIIRPKTTARYIRFYKPKGFESTLNKNNKNSLAQFFENAESLAIAGRLDKDSEGLLLLSNDGKWIEQMCNPTNEKEKEYLVRLSSTPEKKEIEQFENGFEFRYKQHSKPCICSLVDSGTLKIILTEGKNRQIRRMWYKLGYKVENLLRVRIDNYSLDDLTEGQQSDFQID